MKTMSLKHAFLYYLKRFGTAEKVLKSNDCKACILTVIETIWNCREKVKWMSLNNALWRYLKLFWNAKTILKTMELKHAFWRYFKRFGTAHTNNKNNVSKACIVMVFETILTCRENFESNEDSKWCILPHFWDIRSTTLMIVSVWQDEVIYSFLNENSPQK